MSEKTDKILKELGYEPAKTKTPQAQTPNVPQGRDLFQTPSYAVDILIPFIPRLNWVWECACGDGKIVRRLLENSDLDVYASDIRQSPIFKHDIHNFLTDGWPPVEWSPAWFGIITNPPFSLKQKFYTKCLQYKVPFALLIPAEYAIWIIDAIENDGAEKIIPRRRVDFITPSGKSGASGNTADFHSMWLTWGFGLGKTETFVELSLEDKKSNI